MNRLNASLGIVFMAIPSIIWLFNNPGFDILSLILFIIGASLFLVHGKPNRKYCVGISIILSLIIIIAFSYIFITTQSLAIINAIYIGLIYIPLAFSLPFSSKSSKILITFCIIYIVFLALSFISPIIRDMLVISLQNIILIAMQPILGITFLIGNFCELDDK